MNAVRVLDLVDALSTTVLFLIFVVGLVKIGVPNRIRRLYSVRVNLLSMLPFTARWQKEVASEHIESYKKTRRWYFYFLIAVFAVTFLRFIYTKFFFMRLHGFDLKNYSLHVEYTDKRPKNDADTARAAAMVKNLQLALNKYQNYRVAETEGFMPLLPQLKVPVVLFTKRRNGAFAFNEAEPESLLYKRTAEGGYKLIGATYVEQKDASQDELNQHVPLSVARWHRYVNLCLPDRRSDPKKADWTKFGTYGSIATKKACDATGGRFSPLETDWMIDVHPWEQSPNLVWPQ
jgi:hypothetical protein